MAYSYTQEPPFSTPNFAGVYDPIVYVVYESSYASFSNFRYTVDLVVANPEGNNTIPTVKIYPNNVNYGVFELGGLIKNYIKHDLLTNTDQSIDEAPIFQSEEKALQSRIGIAKVTATFGYVYDNSEGVEQTVVQDSVNKEFFCVPGFFSDEFGNRQTWTTSSYSLGTTDKKFLSLVSEQTVANKDFAILTFINDVNTGNTDSGDIVRYNEYDSSDTLLDTNVYDISSIAGTSALIRRKLIHIPAGPGNIDAYLTLNANTAYYTVDITTTSPYTPKTEAYKFTLKSECQYTSERLVFANQYGGYDAISFFGNNSLETDEIERETFMQYQGSTFNVDGGTPVDFNTYAEVGGEQTYNVNGTRTITLNTGTTDDTFNTLLKGLMRSPKVYLATASYLTPVQVVDSSIDYQTSINEGTVSYTIKVRHAHKLQSFV